MKNLSIRFVLAVTVAVLTYVTCMLHIADINRLKTLSANDAIIKLLALDTTPDSLSPAAEVEQVRKLNYAKFRRSLLKHRSIYYAQD